jgi:predicted nucleic acid-binding protein
LTETFIDTSFVIAVVNRKDQYHEEAMMLSDLYGGQPLVTTEAVLLGVGNALAKYFKAEAVAVIEDFLESEEVTVVRMGASLFERGARSVPEV